MNVRSVIIALLFVGKFSFKTFAIKTEAMQNNPIEIIILDSTLLGGGKIEIRLYDDGVNTNHNTQSSVFTYDIQANKTRIRLPLKLNNCYGRITYTNSKSKNLLKPLNYGNNLFIFNDCDSIRIYLTGNSVKFSGIGSAKYNVAYKLSSHESLSRQHFKLLNKYYGEGNFEAYFSKSIIYNDSLYTLRKKFLNGYKDSLDINVFNLYVADCWAKYNQEIALQILAHTNRIGVSGNAEYIKNARIKFEDYERNFNEDFLPDSILSKSFFYGDFLFWKEYNAEQLYNPNLLNSLPFLTRFNSIKTKYKGLVKEKVSLINFYFGHIKSDDINESARIALSYTGSPLYRKALINYINSKNGDAYAFSLPDEKGRIHKIEDYRGKLIIMDFWYTGCINCAEQATALRPILKDLKKNQDVVFLSVSIDGTKHRAYWLKSLADETYSSKDDINLLAEGKNAEIIKHYYIQSYPTLIVISKSGKVLSTFPPDPRTDPDGFKSFIISKI